MTPQALTEPSPSPDEIVTVTGLEPPPVPRDAMPTLTEDLEHLRHAPEMTPTLFAILRWLDACRAEISSYHRADAANWAAVRHETSSTRELLDQLRRDMGQSFDAVGARLEEGNAEFARLARQNIELMTAYGAIVGSLRPSRQKPHGITLLIVDDEPYVVSALARLFESRGIRALEARNSAEAIEALKSDPSVAMVDILLGGAESGLDLIRAMKEIRPTLKCLIYSAMVTEAQREAASALGARIIDKPAKDVDDLVNEIVRAHGAELAP